MPNGGSNKRKSAAGQGGGPSTKKHAPQAKKVDKVTKSWNDKFKREAQKKQSNREALLEAATSTQPLSRFFGVPSRAHASAPPVAPITGPPSPPPPQVPSPAKVTAEIDTDGDDDASWGQVVSVARDEEVEDAGATTLGGPSGSYIEERPVIAPSQDGLMGAPEREFLFKRKQLQTRPASTAANAIPRQPRLAPPVTAARAAPLSASALSSPTPTRQPLGPTQLSGATNSATVEPGLKPEQFKFCSGMTRSDFLEKVGKRDPALQELLQSAVIGRTHTLTRERADAVRQAQTSVWIPTERGCHSLLEGSVGEPCALVEWMGFPLKRTAEEILSGDAAMFPPRCTTGKLLRLSHEGGPKRLLLDSVSAPGVTKKKDDQPDQPDWPPEKSACLDTMPVILKLLQDMPYHRGHGGVPFKGLEAALAKLGYDRCQPLPIPPLEGFAAAVHSSTSHDIPALVTVKSQHEYRCEMFRIGRGARTLAARSVDASEAFLRTMIEDKPYVVEGRMHAVVENSYGVLQGGKTWLDVCDEWSHAVYGRAFNTLEDSKKAVVLTALDGVACYGREPTEWSKMKGPYAILFADNPEIVRIVQGPFDTRRAGKQIRASHAGDERARLSTEVTEARANGNTGPITTSDGQVLPIDWMTCGDAGTKTHEQVRLLKQNKLDTAKVPAAKRQLQGLKDGGMVSSESTADFWWDTLHNDTHHTKEQLFGLLSSGKLLGEDRTARVLANPLVSVFMAEMVKANSAAGTIGGSANYTAEENKARGKDERSTRQGKSDGAKTRNTGAGFAQLSDGDKYVKLCCDGKKCEGVVHEWQVITVPKPAVRGGKVVLGQRVSMVKAHPECDQYGRGTKHVSRRVHDDCVSETEFGGVRLVR